MISTTSIRTTAPPPAAPSSTGTMRSKPRFITGGAGDVGENTGRAVDDLIGDSIATEIETEEVDAAVCLTSDVDDV